MSRRRGASRAAPLALAVLTAIGAGVWRFATAVADLRGVTAEQDGPAAWARILDDHVDARGRIDFRGLAASPTLLERHVRWLASHGPRTTPVAYATAEAVLSYHLNAYNALTMWTVLRSGPAGTLDAWRRLGVFMLTPVHVDGAWTSLYSYENQVIRPLGDPRVHFALNCMVRGCPRLPRVPFSADALDEQLVRAAQEFTRDPRRVRVDFEAGTVWLSTIFSFYTADFLVHDASIIAYVNRYRDRQDAIPAVFAVRYAPYDWTVNRQDSD